jgi:hypothetical protein
MNIEKDDESRSLFTYRDDIEGKVGIGKLPNELHSVLGDISKEYSKLIPNKDVSTYHTWCKDLPPDIKANVEKIQKNEFWHKLCDGSGKCISINASEMDELYYSNPKNNLQKINLYGAVGNYDIHKDCIYNFDGIKFYRIIIGMTDGNKNVITYFNNLEVGHKINTGDYIAFDFDRTIHQVVKTKEGSTPRILMKIHYIVCENCKHSKAYVETVKKCYLYYEFVTRYIMETGTDPETFYEFFMGLGCQYFYTKHIEYILLGIVVLSIIIIKFCLKIKFIFKNVSKVIKYIFLSLVLAFLASVLFYWLRYQLFGIR